MEISDKDMLGIENDLKELAHALGGFDELIKKVQELKERDDEAANDRFMDPERQ